LRWWDVAEEVVMLVPAIAFAGWLVSMSTPAPHAKLARVMSYEAAPPAEAMTETSQTDTEDEPSPAEAATVSDNSDEAPSAGQRVSVKLVTPELVRLARSFLDLPMGAERPVNVDGRRYLFVLEHHYHPPGFVGGPNGWHKGVTVYELR
jgi:hypothetical protein